MTQVLCQCGIPRGLRPSRIAESRVREEAGSKIPESTAKLGLSSCDSVVIAPVDGSFSSSDRAAWGLSGASVMREIAADVLAELRRGEAVALATLVHVQRSAPRLPGAHCAVFRSGALSGAISAGCVESDLIEWSRSVLSQGTVRLVSYDVADAEAMRIGLTCGGAIDVLVERVNAGDAKWMKSLDEVVDGRAVGMAVAIAPDELLGRRLFVGGVVRGSIDPSIDDVVVSVLGKQLMEGGSRNLDVEWNGVPARIFIEGVAPPPRLVIVGATQTALPLIRLAKDLDFHVCVIDPREVYADEERVRLADQVVRQWPVQALAAIDINQDTYVVTLTHDAKFDLPTLRAVLRSPARYIGALGSRRTHARRVEALRDEGFTERELARIHAPVGLDLGGRAPAEIALSIMAEVTAVRFGKRE